MSQITTTATTQITARDVRDALRAQPALLAEAQGWERAYRRAEAVALIALRLGCGVDAAAAGLYRLRHPTSRVDGVYYYSRNGGQTRQYTSVVSGGDSPTWCAGWRITRRVCVWVQDEYAELESALAYVSAALARGVHVA